MIRKKGRWIEIELSRGGEKRRNAGCGESGTDQSLGDTGEVGGSGLVTWQQGASPDWRSPESGARALGAGGPAGAGGGQLCRQERGGLAAAAPACSVPSSPARAPAPAPALQLPPRALRRQGRDPASPPRLPPSHPGQEGAGASGGAAAGLG